MSHHPERTARNVRPVNQPPSLYYDINGESFWGYFMDSVKVVSGAFMIKAGVGIMAAAGWTGIGLAGGAALAALGIDQLTYGAQNIKNRLEGRGLETGTFIQQSYRSIVRHYTGREGSNLEKTLDYAYLGATITAACATGYMSVTRSITAIKSTEPIHTAGHWVVNQRNFIEYEYYISGGVSIYEAGAVVASETFDVTLSFMSFFESPDNEDGPIVEDIENGK